MNPIARTARSARDRAPVVVLACASDWASPARLARVLARGGARVVAISARGHALAATRFVDQLIEAPVELEGFVETLRAHLANETPAWTIIADDPLLDALRRRRQESWLRGILPIENAWSDVMGSKAAFCDRARNAGLPVPASRTCETELDAHRALELGAPIVLKRSSGFAGLAVRLVRDTSEVAQAWRELQSTTDPIVAQTFVAGPIGNTVFLMDRGQPLCWMSAIKARTYGGPFGPSSARQFMTHAEVAPLLAQLGELTGYHGFGALDWVLGADHHLHVIELNTRPVPTIHMGPRAGVDFSAAVRGMLAGAPTLQPPGLPPQSARVYPMFPEDVWRAAHDRTFELRDLPGRSDVPWEDPALLWHHLRGFYRVMRQGV